MDIKIGDIVKVENVGAEYTTYAEFFNHNGIEIITSNISLKDIARYRLYRESLSDCAEYEVLFIGRHHITEEEMAFIKPINKDNYYSTYLIETRGLSLSKKKMTYSELRDIVGFDFQIVDEINE